MTSWSSDLSFEMTSSEKGSPEVLSRCVERDSRRRKEVDSSLGGHI